MHHQPQRHRTPQLYQLLNHQTMQVRLLAEAFAFTVVPILTGCFSEGRSALVTIGRRQGPSS